MWVLIYFFLGSDIRHVTHGQYDTLRACQEAGVALKAASTARIITACEGNAE